MITKLNKNTLEFDGCDLLQLAKEYGTPLYVYSENDIINKCDELKECFINKYENTRVAYASKAFSTMAIYKIMQREGMCLDIVSSGELYTAIKAGFPSERIEFNGNNKLKSEIELAVEYNIGRIIVDGLREINLIEEVCKEKNKKMKILLRVTPGVKSDSHDYIVTGKKDSKFGIPLDDDVIYPQIENAINSKYVEFLGFQFHVGSQLHDNASHLAALETILSLVKNTKEKFNFDVKELNVGGGFGIKYTQKDDKKPFSYFLEPIMNRIEEYFKAEGVKRPTISIEPGRSMVGEAGISLYTIGSIKDIKGVRKYVSVDGGMSDNIRPALYQAEYDADIVNKVSSEKTDKVTICGKCCESGDILIKDILLQKAETGDILAVYSTGAYGYSMANNYNKNNIPAVVLVNNKKSELIVKRQSFDDMIKNELIPDYLK